MKPGRALPRLVAAMLVVVGVIHLLPSAGVLGAARLTALYGVAVSEPSVVLMLRHRALLFGLLGLFLLVAAFLPALRGVALTAAAASVVSFLVLAWPPGDLSAPLRRVFVADVIALACLAVGGAAHLIARRGERATRP